MTKFYGGGLYPSLQDMPMSEMEALLKYAKKYNDQERAAIERAKCQTK